MFDFTVKYRSNHQELHHWCFWDNIPKLLEGILKKRNKKEQDQKPKKGRKKVFHWIEILSLNLIAISIKAFSDLSHIFWDVLPFYLHLHFFNTFINISILHSQHDFSAHPFIDSSLQSYNAMQYIYWLLNKKEKHKKVKVSFQWNHIVGAPDNTHLK